MELGCYAPYTPLSLSIFAYYERRADSGRFQGIIVRIELAERLERTFQGSIDFHLRDREIRFADDLGRDFRGQREKTPASSPFFWTEFERKM